MPGSERISCASSLLCLDQCSDVEGDLLDLAVEDLDKAANAFGHGSIIGLAAAVLLLGAHEDQLIAPLCQPCEGVAGRCGDLLGGGLHGTGKGRQHSRVNRIGFGELAACTGKVTGTGRVDPGEADAGLTQRLAELEVIDTGGLKDDQRIASPTRHQLCDGLCRVGDAFRSTPRASSKISRYCLETSIPTQRGV